MNRKSFNVIFSVVLLGLVIEWVAPVVEKKYRISSFIEMLMNVESDSSVNKVDHHKSSTFPMINVKSSKGLSFKIPKHCTLEFLDSSRADLIEKDVKDKKHTLSSNLKLNDLFEISESADTGTTDVISCNGTDSLWNIVIGYFPSMPSINESNIMDNCVMFGEMINKIHNGQAKLIKCEIEEETIGTNNVFFEFDVDTDKAYGRYKRFVYNFYYNKYFYNLFGQCHIDGTNDCDAVSNITLEIAKSFKE